MRVRKIGILGVCGIVLLAVFLLSLIPIGLVSEYDRMFSDDYDYSVLTRRAVSEGGGVSGVCSAAVETVRQTYDTWQGTYSAVFLFSLQPAIWRQGWYAVTPLILIGTLVFGLGWFCYAVCVDLLRMDRRAWLAVWMVASILCVQFPRDASEGFFWYNGGMFYTFFFGLLLLWLGLAIGTAVKRNIGRARFILRSVFLVLLSFLLAGGNYPTALLFGILLTVFTAWSALRYRRMLPTLLVALIVFGIGFYFNIVAPGNSVRQALLERQTPITAVLSAIAGTPVRLLGQFLRHPGILAILLLVWSPLCLVLLNGSERRFRFPLPVAILSFLLLAAMFTPSYYAMGNAGSYRLWNIVMFAFYLLLMINLYYAAGWWKRRFPAGFSKALSFLQKRKRIAPAYLLLVVALSICLSGVGLSLGIERESATSVRAAQALENDGARRYAEAFDRQAAAIEATTGGEAVVKPIPEPGALLPDGDLTRYIPISYEPSRWFDRELKLEKSE